MLLDLLPPSLKQILIEYAYSIHTFHKKETVVIQNLSSPSSVCYNGMIGIIMNDGMDIKTYRYAIKLDGISNKMISVRPWNIGLLQNMRGTIQNKFHIINVYSFNTKQLLFDCSVKSSDCIIHLRMQIIDYYNINIRDILILSKQWAVIPYHFRLSECGILSSCFVSLIHVNDENNMMNIPSLHINASYERKGSESKKIKKLAVNAVRNIKELNEREKTMILQSLNNNGCIDVEWKMINRSQTEYIMYILRQNRFNVLRKGIPMPLIW